jgi:integrase
VENRHGLLSSTVNRAVREEVLPGNPIRGLAIPESPELDMTFLTPEEWWLIHDCLAAHWHPLCLIRVGTGLRFGEATALRPTSIDLVNRKVRVTRAWKEDANGHRYIGTPKSKAGKRSVQYDEQLDPIFKQLVHERDSSELLLVNRAGNPILNNSFHSRGWGNAITKAQEFGLKKTPRPHDLRHTFASWALASGDVNIFMLSVIMGHDSSKVTQERYGHLMPASMLAVGVALERPMPLPRRPIVK